MTALNLSISSYGCRDRHRVSLAEYDLPVGSRVLLRLPSGPTLARALVTCWDLGWVGIPLDSADTAERQDAIRRHARPHAIYDGFQLHELDDVSPVSSSEHAFIVYTSGSTGEPKGVVLSRTAVLANALAVQNVIRAPGAPHATLLPLHHCNALVLSVMGCAFTGGDLVLIDKESTPKQIRTALEESRAATLSLAPALLERLSPRDIPETVETVLSASAPLGAPLAHRHTGRHYALRQGYGLSEITNFSFVQDPGDIGREMSEGRGLSVGRRLPGTEFRMSPEGEVLIRGAYLSAGYWNPKTFTASWPQEAMLEGYFRTGDIGQVDSYGRLVLLGRIRETINMGGKTHYPIDLEEEYQRYRPGKRVVFPVPTGDYTDEEPGVICDSIVDVIALPAALRHHGARQPAVVVAGTVPATATGKPQRRQLSARYGHARTLPPSAYGRLRLVAVELAHEILNSVTETHLLAGHRVRAVAKDAQRLVDRESSLEDLRAEYGREVLGSFPLGEWAARLARHPTTMGTDLSAGWMDLNLWTRMMCDDLMGEYARMAVDFLRANEIQKRSILELGSGVGNARRLLSPHLPVGDSYFPTDFLGAEEETPGRPWRFDFDSAVDWGALAAGERLRVSSGFGCVFAVNALHCSIAPAEVICRATAALAPGGLLLLGEGNPSPLDDSTPWAGDLLFSPFNGWWDRGGFRPRESWVTWMIEAGLHDIGYAVLRSGKYDLGGLVWAWKK